MHRLYKGGTVLLMGLLLAACSGGEERPGGSEKAQRLPGVDVENKIIRIGALNGESGPAGVIGKPYAVGKRLLVEQVNAGGLLPDGWKLELIERDHGYNPQRSVQLFNEIRDQVLFIATSFGTPNTLPLRPMLERHQIVAFPASLSSKMAEFKFTPPVAPSYIVEAQRGFDWALEQAGGAENFRPGVIYQQDDYGKDGYDGWVKAAAHHGIQIVAEQTYAPGQADYTAAVSALKKAGATHVLLTTLPSATGPILGAATQLDYKPVWIGNTPAWIDRFFDPEVIPSKVFERFYLVSSVPYWGEPSDFMDQFLAAYEAYGRQQAQQDGYILLSYLQGALELEALVRAIKAGDLSRAGYLAALQSIKDFRMNDSVPYAVSFDAVPYVAGVETRVMQPLLEKRSWRIVAPFAAPQSPH